MRRTVSLFVAAVFVLGASVVSMAGPRGINRREYREQQRINQGIRSCELTRPEARRVQAGLARIRINERIFRADGYLSPQEHARLSRQLNHESRVIYRQKHDSQDRNP